MTVISLMQGVVAGGTASYLRDRVKQEAALKKPDTWVTTALQANHALLLSAETARFAGLSLGSFGLAVQAAYICTPLTFAIGLYTKQVMPLSSERADQLSNVYRAAVVVNSLATLALGNPVFAAASLSMLAIDVVASGNTKELFAYVKKAAAVLALVGYGAQAFAAEGIMAGLAKVSTVAAGIKLFLVDNGLLSSEGNSLPSDITKSTSFPTERKIHDCCHNHEVYVEGSVKNSSSTGFSPPSVNNLPSSILQSSGNWFTRASVWN